MRCIRIRILRNSFITVGHSCAMIDRKRVYFEIVEMRIEEVLRKSMIE